ncbi:pentatricopeptide repeat-containing protein At4g02750-like [Selaginella moellendorffii]|uniref:pentatricopeptide repeat-containing protein At4g02750-like n=1 Tax=Selaginella moellendorffii TaxID=88036 RepID=UPI000D1C2341|nr:pentatricopeptide repeat-containing protein At4g02750-like [Selaginella moellendorffii]|eukprot:XP_024526556.1 pentatricopeptide repeat-containing protein At4g02750-like [Selaginella moellendorffii]
MWKSKNGEILEILDRHDRLGTSPDLAALLKKCGDSRALESGKRVHLSLAKAGRDRETLAGNLLVQMYGKCGSPEDARAAFERIKEPDAYSWNILVEAYALNGHLDIAKEVFSHAPVKNAVSWNGMLRAYSRVRNLEETRHLFDEMPERNVVAWTSMLTAYAQRGHILEAYEIFGRMPQRDCVAWNAMIAAYAQNGHSLEALVLFRAMALEGERANEGTFLVALDAIAQLRALREGRIIHATAREIGFDSIVAVANAIVAMYGKCGSVESALGAFAMIEQKDVISWTAMINAYAQNGHLEEALLMSKLMLIDGTRPNEVTYLCVLGACLVLQDGRSLHHCVDEQDANLVSKVSIGTALITMYGKFGCVEDAERIFHSIVDHSVVSWTAMLAVYVANGHFEMAFLFFKFMDLNGITPNKVTASIMIQACADRPSLYEGSLIHSSIDFASSDAMVVTALVDLYGKCGRVEEAMKIFGSASCKNVRSWTSMSECFARNGCGKQAIVSFQTMALEGMEPDTVSLISILAGCSHGGLLHDGLHYFLSITGDFHLTPIDDHYACLVDLLGRAGKLELVENLVQGMEVTGNTKALRNFHGVRQVHMR